MVFQNLSSWKNLYHPIRSGRKIEESNCIWTLNPGNVQNVARRCSEGLRHVFIVNFVTISMCLDPPTLSLRREMCNIERLPPVNKRVGSCPECGKPIWESDKVGPVYRCVECREIIREEELIPF